MWIKQQFKRLRYAILMGVSLLCALGLTIIPLHAQDLDVPSEPVEAIPDAVEEAPEPELGWTFLGQRELNQVTIPETEYYGDCPGRTRNHVEARFVSEATPPADRRRVIVRNITRGLDDDPLPYTDREYYEGRASEETNMRFGTKHSGRYFHVLPGENQFEYEIRTRRRRGQVIDSGTFTATIERELQRVKRDATFGTDQVCANSRVDLDVCADVRDRHKWSCPNGDIVSSQLFPSHSRITTEIHNQTNRTLEVSINGRMRRIYEGSYYDFSSRHPSVRYESGSGRRSRSLTSGTRYRFYERDGQVRLEEYRRHSRW